MVKLKIKFIFNPETRRSKFKFILVKSILCCNTEGKFKFRGEMLPILVISGCFEKVIVL